MREGNLFKSFSRLDKYERELTIFFFKGLFYDASKIVIFFLLFSLFNMTTYFWYSLLYLILFRSSSGGIHCNSYLGCLTISLLVLSISIILGIYVFIPILHQTIFTILLGIITVFFSPVLSSSRPNPGPSIIKRAKIRSSICIFVLIVLLTIYPKTIFSNIGFWSLVIHTFQLFIAHLRRWYHVFI